jgi:hypothetical protein
LRERSLGNTRRRRIPLRWILAMIRCKWNWPRMIFNVFGVSDV